jgi:hypothetical protein
MNLIILSNRIPNHPTTLAYIPRLPSGGSLGDYLTQCVTRNNTLQYFRFKIPLYPKLLSIANVGFVCVQVLITMVAVPDILHKLYFQEMVILFTVVIYNQQMMVIQ